MLKAFEAETGYSPFTTWEPDDIFVAAYPKSGSTWFQSLIAGTVYGINLEHASYKLIGDIVPEYGRDGYYKRYQTPMFYKTHELPDPKMRRVVHLVRDGRDVMVSYYYFRHARGTQKKSDYWDIARGETVPPRIGLWHTHTDEWLSNPYGADILRIRYEDLLEDGLTELQRFCEFARIERPTGWLQDVLTQTDFKKMREREQRDGMGNLRKWPKDKMFMRRGKSGSFKDEMPVDVLNTFMKIAGSTMDKLGYR
jgi:hypothetical protein